MSIANRASLLFRELKLGEAAPTKKRPPRPPQEQEQEQEEEQEQEHELKREQKHYFHHGHFGSSAILARLKGVDVWFWLKRAQI